ncbi:uncharacterized protein EKO05_0000776 [Ascochyta rabiei]|uniref:Uncharacterized protein n=1 Tax=Didymella rabiei TaxID=5454 RepID=A0A163CV39_DIDRA|nr:uncharacterized protein EKO05_0000776 [Ascochyta rabiei]KZM22711.1 hypothetical protein ST47_g6145 [Ascochyta rabiei]UPX10105.1 hypothetical protein EKO05_0000776 [Ascochyta rabiei]
MMTLDDPLKDLKKDNGGKMTDSKIATLFKPWVEKHNKNLRATEMPNTNTTSGIKLVSAQVDIVRLHSKQLSTKAGKYDRDDAFLGTIHAEKLLIGHTPLKRKRNTLIAKSTSEKLDYLKLPGKAIPDRLEATMKHMPVSEKCCPACWVLVRFLQDEQEHKIMFPGHHTKWSATTLLPTLPRDAGWKAMDYAEMVLPNRLT